MFWFESIWSSFRCQSLQYSLLRLRWWRRKNLVRNSIPESKWSEDPDDHCYWLHHQLFPLKRREILVKHKILFLVLFWDICSDDFCVDDSCLRRLSHHHHLFPTVSFTVFQQRKLLMSIIIRIEIWSNDRDKKQSSCPLNGFEWDFEWCFEEESRTRDNRLRRGLNEYKGS